MNGCTHTDTRFAPHQKLSADRSCVQNPLKRTVRAPRRESTRHKQNEGFDVV